MKTPWPPLTTDDEAERFVAEADLTAYDFSAMVPVPFEFAKKGAAFNMRIPQPLLDAVKAKAKAKGIPFTRYVRMLIEQDVMRS
jgi:predicted DNA binding CopG/RHH family protein